MATISGLQSDYFGAVNGGVDLNQNLLDSWSNTTAITQAYVKYANSVTHLYPKPIPAVLPKFKINDYVRVKSELSHHIYKVAMVQCFSHVPMYNIMRLCCDWEFLNYTQMSEELLVPAEILLGNFL